MGERQPVADRLMRPLTDLRISVTDRCNFRCVYCMPAHIFGPDFAFLPKEEILSYEEMARVVRLFAELGVDKVRITGGEPLLRKDLPRFVAMIRQMPGIREIALTTNGSLLASCAEELRRAGLDRVSVSLDSLDDERFGRINGRGFPVRPVLEGIEKALAAGLGVKVNMVVKRGANDRDILPMARYFKERRIPLRFIEYMDVGNTNGWVMDEVVPSREVMETIAAEMPLVPAEPGRYGEVAERWRYADDGTEVGFISSVTRPFCATCTRARLSADGRLYTCLFAAAGTDLRTPLRSGATDEQMRRLIRDVWRAREDRYSELRSEAARHRPKVEMSRIGG